MRHACLATTLLLLAGSVRGADTAPPLPEPTAPPPVPSDPAAQQRTAPDRDPDDVIVRPYLQAGLLFGNGGGVGVDADLGIRVGRVVAWSTFRAMFQRETGYWSEIGGRAGWVVAENEWIGFIAGLGAGGLAYHYDEGPPARVAVLWGHARVLFLPRDVMSLASIAFEAAAPFDRAPDPRNATIARPSYVFSVTLNALLVARMFAH